MEKSYGRYFRDDLSSGAVGAKTIIEHKSNDVFILASYNHSNPSDTYYKLDANFEIGDIVSVYVPSSEANTYNLYDENDNLLLGFSGGVSFIKSASGWLRIFF